MHAQVAPWSVFDGPPRGQQRFGCGCFVRVAQGWWSLRCRIGSPTLCQVLSLWVEEKGRPSIGANNNPIARVFAQPTGRREIVAASALAAVLAGVRARRTAAARATISPSGFWDDRRAPARATAGDRAGDHSSITRAFSTVRTEVLSHAVWFRRAISRLRGPCACGDPDRSLLPRRPIRRSEVAS